MQKISCPLAGSMNVGRSHDRFSSSNSLLSVGKNVSGSTNGPSDSITRWIDRSPTANVVLMLECPYGAGSRAGQCVSGPNACQINVSLIYINDQGRAVAIKRRCNRASCRPHEPLNSIVAPEIPEPPCIGHR